MNKFKKQLTLLFILSTFSLKICLEEKSFNYSEENFELSKEIINILEREHFIKKSFSSIKVDAFELFLERLDPSKSIFLDREVRNFLEAIENYPLEKKSLYTNLELKKIPRSFDDLDKSLKLAFEAFGIFQDRYQQRHDFQTQLLGDIKTLNLRQTKKILKDRSEAPQPRNLQQLQDLWESSLVNDVINLNLNGNDLEEIKNKLSKRFATSLNYFKKTKQEDIFDIYINSVTSIYGPHSSYMSPKRTEDFDIDMKLSLEGIGALLSSDGLYTTVQSLVAGGPAENSNKLNAKDKIVGVGQEDDEEITDVIGWRIDDVVELIRGPKDTVVKLEIIPSSSLDESHTKVIEITRNLVKLEDLAAKKNILSITREGKEYKIGVIELPAFYMDFDAYKRREYDYKSSSKDVRKLINSLKRENIDGLILDLRNNGGGSLFEANSLAHIFLGGGTTVQVKTAKGSVHELGDRRGFQIYDDPLLILVNKFSASASEILAGAVQDYRRGLVVGTDTFGKGTVQKVETLSSGQIKFTESKFYRVSGGSTQNKGISPDINLPSPIDVEEIGEHKYLGALVHDNIRKTKFKDFDRIGSSKELLTLKHKERMSQSSIFKNLKEKKSWRAIQDNNIWVSLNIDKRKVNKERAEQELLSLENELRREMGLETFQNYKEFVEREKDPEVIDIDEAILKESANILADFIEYSFQPVVVSIESTG